MRAADDRSALAGAATTVIVVVCAIAGGVRGAFAQTGGSTLQLVLDVAAGIAIAGIVALTALGVIAAAYELLRHGRPEPSIDTGPATEDEWASRFGYLAITCYLVGTLLVASVVMWFLALVFGGLARNHSYPRARWHRIGTLIYVITAITATWTFLVYVRGAGG